MAENSQTLRITPFHVGEDHITNADRWDEWIEELELNFRVSGITESSKKKDILLLYGGKEVRKLDKSIVNTLTSTEDEYEALMRRTVRTKLDFPRESEPNLSKMEKEITDKDKEYKRKWDSQHRHPRTKANNFQIGEMVLLKKKKENKWSSAYEREYYTIIRINGSSIQAQRKSDGRKVFRDASKFKRFHENNDGWRERLLRIPEKNQIIQDPRDNRNQNDVFQIDPTNSQTTNNGTDNQIHKEHKNTQKHARRELPKRLRRLPSRFKDYILDHKK